MGQLVKAASVSTKCINTCGDYNYRISVGDMPFGACCIYGDDTHSGPMCAYLRGTKVE